MGGGGATYDYGFRIYNPQLAKFLSVDPLTRSYPWYTPYQFAANKPINCIDIDGLEEQPVNVNTPETEPNRATSEIPDLNSLPEVVIIGYAPKFWDQYGGVAKIGISTALDFIPFVGTAKGIVEAVTGRDLITGEKLQPWERALGLIPIVGKLGRGAKAIGKVADGIDAIHDIKKLQKGAVATESLTDAAKAADRVADNHSRGKAAETFIAESYGGAGKGFKVGDTWRYVDNFDEAAGLARESKVGRVSATTFTKAQLQKDFQLLMDDKSGVQSVEWLFSKSSKTGKGGYTDGFKAVVDGLNKQLEAAGKNVIKLTETNKTF